MILGMLGGFRSLGVSEMIHQNGTEQHRAELESRAGVQEEDIRRDELAWSQYQVQRSVRPEAERVSSRLRCNSPGPWKAG